MSLCDQMEDVLKRMEHEFIGLSCVETVSDLSADVACSSPTQSDGYGSVDRRWTTVFCLPSHSQQSQRVRCVLSLTAI